MPLTLMYITNNPEVALIAEKNGVDRVWIDLETLGKAERQGNMDTVKSQHSIDDILSIKPLLTQAELLVRINPINSGSREEIDKVIEAGADLIMLPMWKSVEDVTFFLSCVDGRAKTVLLLETKEAAECLNDVIGIGGFQEIHIGLNDLHLSYGKRFMFELLSDGTVEKLCRQIAQAGIPYGFGGVARLGMGALPAEKVIMEHYRLGSTRAILSRSFCNYEKCNSMTEVENIFANEMEKLRTYEMQIQSADLAIFKDNQLEVVEAVEKIAKSLG